MKGPVSSCAASSDGGITLFTPAPSAPQTRVPGEGRAPVMWLRKPCEEGGNSQKAPSKRKADSLRFCCQVAFSQ